MNTVHPTLSRSINDRVLAGVIGGVAHRFGWNSTLLRFIYVVLSVVSIAGSIDGHHVNQASACCTRVGRSAMMR